MPTTDNMGIRVHPYGKVNQLLSDEFCSLSIRALPLRFPCGSYTKDRKPLN